ncbi:MAG: barstar family protein [Bacteriovorax sp.]|nr:barstar family protein [Bacteriovorax sp.]
MFKKALLALGGIFLSLQVMASGSVLISGKEIKSREQLHAIFAKQLNFPRFYAKTLDSLYDNLSSDYSGESVIKIKHVNLLKAKLGTDYIDAMIQAIMDAAEDNPRIILVLE